MKEGTNIEHSWNFGKEFFEMLSDMRKNHIQCSYNLDFLGMATTLIDEIDLITPDVTDKEDKKKLEKQITELTKIESKLRKTNNKRLIRSNILKIRTIRRVVWNFERKYKLDHPDTIAKKDPNKSLEE